MRQAYVYYNDDLTGNNDMHLKNFSMMRTPIGWELTPAYDLLNVSIALPEDTEELALTLSGKKRKLTKKAGYVPCPKAVTI